MKPATGMPVLEAWKVKTVFVSKCGQSTGYSGIYGAYSNVGLGIMLLAPFGFVGPQTCTK